MAKKIKVTRQLLYDKGYTMNSASYELTKRGYPVSSQTIRLVCRGEREPKPQLLEAILSLPKKKVV